VDLVTTLFQQAPHQDAKVVIVFDEEHGARRARLR
jgi:hypothetical protein